MRHVTDQAAHAFVDKLAGRFDVAWAVIFGSRARQEEWAHPEDFINPALLRNISRDGVRL